MRIRSLSAAFMAVILSTAALGQSADDDLLINNYAPQPEKTDPGPGNNKRDEGLNAISSAFGFANDELPILYILEPDSAPALPSITPLPDLPTATITSPAPAGPLVDNAIGFVHVGARLCVGTHGVVRADTHTAPDDQFRNPQINSFVKNTFDCLTPIQPYQPSYALPDIRNASGSLDMLATFHARAALDWDISTNPALLTAFGAQLGIPASLQQKMNIAELSDQPVRVATSLESLGYTPK